MGAGSPISAGANPAAPLADPLPAALLNQLEDCAAYVHAVFAAHVPGRHCTLIVAPGSFAVEELIALPAQKGGE